MSFYVKKDGAPVEIVDPRYKVAGIDTAVNAVYTKVGGVREIVWLRQPSPFPPAYFQIDFSRATLIP
jgi:hypothetical protein